MGWGVRTAALVTVPAAALGAWALRPASAPAQPRPRPVAAAPALAATPAPIPTTAPPPVPAPPTTAARSVARAATSAAPTARPAVAPASAVAVGAEQRRGEQALARITYPWRQLGFSVSFLPGRPGLFGKTVPAEHRIEIYVRTDEDDLLLTHMVAHELGHAVDVSYSDDARRARWLQLRGIDPATPWFGCSLCTDYQTPAGDFAETFALWQAGPRDFRSRMAPPPDAQQLASLQPLFSA